jgi:hypothetical protein
MTRLLERMTRLQDIEARDAWGWIATSSRPCRRWACPTRTARWHPWRRASLRALCRALTEHLDLLLLDEPTNHLDADTVTWLEKHL